MSTLYASFVDAAAAESATGALLDHGATAADISIVANEAYNSIRSVNANAKAMDAEAGAKSGISTTTGGDAAIGAVKGTAIGIGVGAAAVLASIFIPGLGLVIGGGALATALAGGAATVLAGTAAGGVVGYLVDQGVPEDFASRYNSDFVQGGAILAISIPTGSLTNGEVEDVLVKYGAMNIATYNSSNVLINDPAIQQVQVPLNVGNPNIDPISTTATVVVPTETRTTEVIEASTGESRLVTTQTIPAVSPTSSPVTGVAIDPVTGLQINPIPATPSVTTAVVVDPATGLTREVVVEEEPIVVKRV